MATEDGALRKACTTQSAGRDPCWEPIDLRAPADIWSTCSESYDQHEEIDACAGEHRMGSEMSSRLRYGHILATPNLHGHKRFSAAAGQR
eukprot:4703513-Amphidinium_carterae.1